MSLPLSAPVFTILASLIEERLGIHYDPIDAPVLAAKLSGRAMEAGFDSLLDYYYFVRYDPQGSQELQSLAEHLVVNETYFFREFAAIEFLAREILAPRALAGHNLRVWSAACATGEEPLTLAMLLADMGVLPRVEIVATDISDRALAVARSGTFPRRSVRSSAIPAFARPYLQMGPDERPRVSQTLIEQVRFSRLNLMEDPAVAELGTFDAILCRNVLIYFAEPTVRSLITRLNGALKPDGALFVGVSESLLRFGTSLACDERAGIFHYRKVGR